MNKEKPGYFFTYRHFRRDNGAATAACMVHAQDDGTLNMLVGFSFCNPKDMFSKEDGRDYASYRLLENPIFFRNAKGIATTLIKHLKSFSEEDIQEVIKELKMDDYCHSKKDKNGDLGDWFFDFVDGL